MKYLLAGLLLGAVSFGAQAQQVIPTTPDISIGNTATVDVAWFGRADWIAIKNDCADEVYFDLDGARDPGSRNFPIRLGQGESFSGSFNLAGSIEASASSGASGTCTFTLVLRR